MQTKDQPAKSLRSLDPELENSLGNQVEGNIQSETEEFQEKIDQINTELQSFTISNQKLSDKRTELLKKIQITEHHLFVYNNQKLAALDNNKIERYFFERNVYRKQVSYIQKWMEVTEKLVSDVHAIVHCIERQELCSKLGYDFEENHANDIAVKVIYLIVKFKKDNMELLDILLLSKFERIKNLQANTNLMNKIKKKMKELNEEVGGFKIYKKIHVPTYTLSQDDSGLYMQPNSCVQGMWSAICMFGCWLFLGAIFGLF